MRSRLSFTNTNYLGFFIFINQSIEFLCLLLSNLGLFLEKLTKNQKNTNFFISFSKKYDIPVIIFYII